MCCRVEKEGGGGEGKLIISVMCVLLPQLATGTAAFRVSHDYYTMQQVLNFPHAYTLPMPRLLHPDAKVGPAVSW